MSFSNDPNSPAASFSGDDFDQGDLLLQSPITNERVVDTQSGFLVIVKRIGKRLSLSCKRCIGTPPTSAILMTPDESVKLSRILATTLTGVKEPGEDLLDEPSEANFQTERRRRFGLSNATLSLAQDAPPRKAVVAGIAAATILMVGGIFWIGYSLGGHTYEKPKKAAIPNPLDAAKVSSFCRIFVSDMLDFDPDSYKASQIKAMSEMSPELLNQYWQETNFPLSDRRLKSLPQKTTVVINKIIQTHPAPGAVDADIYADLVRPDAGADSKSPVHLHLKLNLANDGHLFVTEQKDVSAEAAPSTTK